MPSKVTSRQNNGKINSNNDITAKKCVGKSDNFEIISPKTETKIYLKN